MLGGQGQLARVTRVGRDSGRTWKFKNLEAPMKHFAAQAPPLPGSTEMFLPVAANRPLHHGNMAIFDVSFQMRGRLDRDSRRLEVWVRGTNQV